MVSRLTALKENGSFTDETTSVLSIIEFARACLQFVPETASLEGKMSVNVEVS
jgi:hypothetical protein